MKTSKTFEQSEVFYNENKNAILETLLAEHKGIIDYQPEFNQVAVWFNGFSICYQNGDMNGNDRGNAIWTNEGADSVFEELGNILKNDARFSELESDDIVCPDYFVREIVNDFCENYAEENNISDYFNELSNE